jgi:hypothetical protein
VTAGEGAATPDKGAAPSETPTATKQLALAVHGASEEAAAHVSAPTIGALSLTEMRRQLGVIGGDA